MPNEAVFIKAHDGSLRPVTARDAELVTGWKVGQAIKIKVARANARSLQHHRLYFGGLLELAMQYWEPSGGLIAPGEEATLLNFARWLDIQGGDTGAIRRAGNAYLQELSARRSDRITAPEKSVEALHEWVKIEAGWFDYVVTPVGLKKKARSINFNVMDQDEFNRFYKAAFSVVWRFILSRTFEDEAQAEAAVNQLMAMG